MKTIVLQSKCLQNIHLKKILKQGYICSLVLSKRDSNLRIIGLTDTKLVWPRIECEATQDGVIHK